MHTTCASSNLFLIPTCASFALFSSHTTKSFLDKRGDEAFHDSLSFVGSSFNFGPTYFDMTNLEQYRQLPSPNMIFILFFNIIKFIFT
jgi:hypothetical protein